MTNGHSEDNHSHPTSVDVSKAHGICIRGVVLRDIIGDVTSMFTYINYSV